MRITFLTGKEPVVKFSDAEKRAIVTVLETLDIYSDRRCSQSGPLYDEMCDLMNDLTKVAENIGLKEKTDDAK